MANTALIYPHAPRQRRTLPAALAVTRVAALSGEMPLVVGLVVLALVAHALNMFHLPAFTFKDDEGIYAAQAWAVLRQGQLAPYTYFYDHAPAGWILIAAWMGLTGGLHTFGGAIDSGRVLMLLLHLGMVVLLYRIVRKLGGGPSAAALAALLFSVSPLAVFYQRLLLLDNIMLFWALLSLDLLLDGWGRLSRLALSGACFGLALLTKETAVFLAPAMLFIALQQRWRHHGRFAVLGWALPMALTASSYPLFATLKGELLPAGVALRFLIFSVGEGGDRVSLVEALRWQASRSGGGLLSFDNAFWQLVRTDWLPRDPVLFAGGALAVGLNLVRGIRDRRAFAAALLGALPLYYLGRGGVVFDYYVLFAIPFLCLNVAVLLAPLLGRLPAPAVGVLTTTAAVLLIGGYVRAGTLQPLYTEQPSHAGRNAIAWIKRHLPAQSLIITRDDLWTDLREPGLGGPAFPNVHSHWKVAADPAIRDGVFRDDWRTVDYLIMSPGLDAAFADTNDAVALDALRNAHMVRRWEADGSVVELWKVNKPGATEAALLGGSAAYVADRFERGGAYVEPNGRVTSEGQAYGMLRAAWSGDREGFYRTWRWTQAHLLDEGGLLAWLWRDGAVADAHTASDADVDAALALLFAAKRWDDPALHDAGRRMVRAIWQREVAVVHGVPHLTAGDWAVAAPVVALNPSYFSPHAYLVFRDVDPEHDWQGLIASSYDVLFAAAGAPLGTTQSAGLPTDWVGLDRDTGDLVPLVLDGDAADTTRYGYDAPRTYWRVALHHRWSHDGRAEAFLRQAGFLRDEVNRKGTISAVYAHDGTIVEAAPSLVGTAGALAVLLTLDAGAAHALYAAHLVGASGVSGAQVYWGNPDDLYAQEWGWFATALYADALPNLWQPAGAAPAGR